MDRYRKDQVLTKLANKNLLKLFNRLKEVIQKKPTTPTSTPVSAAELGRRIPYYYPRKDQKLLPGARKYLPDLTGSSTAPPVVNASNVTRTINPTPRKVTQLSGEGKIRTLARREAAARVRKYMAGGLGVAGTTGVGAGIASQFRSNTPNMTSAKPTANTKVKPATTGTSPKSSAATLLKTIQRSRSQNMSPVRPATTQSLTNPATNRAKTISKADRRRYMKQVRLNQQLKRGQITKAQHSALFAKTRRGYRPGGMAKAFARFKNRRNRAVIRKSNSPGAAEGAFMSRPAFRPPKPNSVRLGRTRPYPGVPPGLPPNLR